MAIRNDDRSLIEPLYVEDDVGNKFYSEGNPSNDPGFNNTVKKIIYPSALPTTNVGSYLVTFIDRVTIRVKVVGTEIYSNTILIQMESPDLLEDEGYLRLEDDSTGRLDLYRLSLYDPTRPIDLNVLEEKPVDVAAPLEPYYAGWVTSYLDSLLPTGSATPDDIKLDTIFDLFTKVKVRVVKTESGSKTIVEFKE